MIASDFCFLYMACYFNVCPKDYIYISHLADVFFQSEFQMRRMDAIKINKRAMICKRYDKSQLA